VTAVLCFGDSNTWGYPASSERRLGRWERWPGVLQRELGEDVHVIEDGLNGRTTMYPVAGEPFRNGLDHLPVALQTHAPLDAVVIMLGTNDLFVPGVTNAHLAAEGAMRLAEMARSGSMTPDDPAPQVLVLIPPPFAPMSGVWASQAPVAVEASQAFGAAFREMAAEWGEPPLLDLGELIASSPLDGIHFEAEDHRAIGEAVAVRLRELLDLG
jgi:lysophospholipase L1-like esterase